MKKIVPFWEEMPFWYGTAYYSDLRAAYVCYPIPINLFVKITRDIWHGLKGGWTSWYEHNKQKGGE